MLRLKVPALLAACVAVLGACGPDAPPPLPADLVPLDAVNQAPLPEPTEEFEYPEAFNTTTGDEGDYHWAHGRGYVRRPMAQVWNALRDPEVLIDRRHVHEWSVTKDIDKTRAASWRAHNIVHDVLTVDFDSEWRLDTSGGTDESPEAVAGRGVKVAGTTFITLLDDSVVLRVVEEDVTLVELIRHADTLNTGEAENEQYVKDVYETLRERAWGRAFPVWK